MTSITSVIITIQHIIDVIHLPILVCSGRFSVLRPMLAVSDGLWADLGPIRVDSGFLSRFGQILVVSGRFWPILAFPWASPFSWETPTGSGSAANAPKTYVKYDASTNGWLVVAAVPT